MRAAGCGRPAPRARRLRRVALTALLLLAPAALAGCGSSAKGLIPSGQAQPLLADFEAVKRAAEQAGGECAHTEAALGKTERDFEALPATVSSALRNNLRLGIENLSVRARERCTQSAAGTNTTKTTTKTTTTPPATSTPTNTGTTNTGPTEQSEAEGNTGSQGSESGGSEAPGGGSSEAPGGESEHGGGKPHGNEEGGAGGVEISK